MDRPLNGNPTIKASENQYETGFCSLSTALFIMHHTHSILYPPLSQQLHILLSLFISYSDRQSSLHYLSQHALLGHPGGNNLLSDNISDIQREGILSLAPLTCWTLLRHLMSHKFSKSVLWTHLEAKYFLNGDWNIITYMKWWNVLTNLPKETFLMTQVHIERHHVRLHVGLRGLGFFMLAH